MKNVPIGTFSNPLPTVQNEVETRLLNNCSVGTLSEAHARELAKIENLDELIEIWRIVNEIADSTRQK